MQQSSYPYNKDPRDEPSFTHSELIAAGYFECPDCEELCEPSEKVCDSTSDEDVCTDCMNRREEICTDDDVCVEGGIVYLNDYPWKKVNEL